MIKLIYKGEYCVVCVTKWCDKVGEGFTVKGNAGDEMQNCSECGLPLFYVDFIEGGIKEDAKDCVSGLVKSKHYRCQPHSDD